MATCKDCICYDILCQHTLQDDELKMCESFKNKADFVEVVRCRDCKHFSKGMAIGMCKRVPDKPIIPMPYNNYCGFGEVERHG